MPSLRVQSFESLFTDELLAQLAALLPEFLRSRRWFRAKARAISKVAIEDVVPFPNVDSSLLVLRITYQDGEEDRYLLPLSLGKASESDSLTAASFEPLAVLQADGESRVLYSALANAAFRRTILSAVADNTTFSGNRGQFVAERVPSPSGAETHLDLDLESSVSRAEQSNTSVIYGQQLILKLFRKVEPGINPDIEIGAFLTENGFENTPAVLATLQYRNGDDIYAAGILQKFVANQGDAWSYTLKELGGFFSRALKSAAIPKDEGDTDEEVDGLVGDYRGAAQLLGRRTAEMHRVLGSAQDAADFVPEPFTVDDGKKLQGEMLKQADITFNLLRQKESSLWGEARDDARQLLASEDQVRQRFSALADSPASADRIRFHGDYHLGQVLFTGNDFMIIDFEGEPARPLNERREKTLALRDVAGMIRSFDYAAYAALFGQVPGVSIEPGNEEKVKRWAALWNRTVAAAYLESYIETAREGAFIPPNPEERQRVLDAFLLHKALYEVAYELNNRPDWVQIPLRGILSILQ